MSYNNIDTLEQHFIIRETAGYDIFKDIDLLDIGSVMDFLKIAYNYKQLSAKYNG